jgi:predicted RNA-binding Zn ribbon-like protein
MTADAARRWVELRQQLDRRAAREKSSQSVVVELSREYARLGVVDRSDIDRLLASWLLSADERDRFDAVAVVDDNAVCSAIPTLRELMDRLESSDEPGAVYEWAKVNRVLGRLAMTCADADC